MIFYNFLKEIWIQRLMTKYLNYLLFLSKFKIKNSTLELNIIFYLIIETFNKKAEKKL